MKKNKEKFMEKLGFFRILSRCGWDMSFGKSWSVADELVVSMSIEELKNWFVCHLKYIKQDVILMIDKKIEEVEQYEE